MRSFEDSLEKYADLVVKVALNIQEGQKLWINSTIESADFVQKITGNAYKAGAKYVYTQFYDPLIRRMTLEQAPEEGLAEFPDWEVNMFDELIDEGGAYLQVFAGDPDLLKGVDPERIAISQKASLKALGRFMEAQSNGSITWCIAPVPTQKWAAKVFPEVEAGQQVNALWKEIFRTTRVNTEDPVIAWEKHIQTLNEKADYLNEKRFRALHYNAPGTNLSIGLAEDHLWKAARKISNRGIHFISNIPTEEVFTMPHKNRVNGTVTSTKPLNYGGSLIKNFSFTFKNGKVVDFQAVEGYDSLKSLLDTDEGVRHLGEVALVPHNSPINDSGLIFFNTLFDENASCHIALGTAFPFNIKDADKYSKEELVEKGYNESITHVDFMIGSANLNIDGETGTGDRVPIFRNGNWTGLFI